MRRVYDFCGLASATSSVFHRFGRNCPSWLVVVDAMRTSTATVERVEWKYGQWRVFNLEIGRVHRYYVSLVDVLVHNDCISGNIDVLEGHHSDPQFMGGDPDQNLTYMDKYDHDDLHSDLNDHLENYRDAKGNTMRPSSRNPGSRIQKNFSREERIAALADFYEEYGHEYPDAANDFFSQHPTYRLKGK